MKKYNIKINRKDGMAAANCQTIQFCAPPTLVPSRDIYNWTAQLFRTGLGVFSCALNILKTVRVEKKKQTSMRLLCPVLGIVPWCGQNGSCDMNSPGKGQSILCAAPVSFLWNFSVILLGICVCPTVNLIPWAWGKGHEVEEDRRPEQTLWENRRDLSG